MSRTRIRKALFFTVGALLLLAAAITFDTRHGAYGRLCRQRTGLSQQALRENRNEATRLYSQAVLYYFAAAVAGLFGLIAWFRPTLLEWRPKEPPRS